MNCFCLFRPEQANQWTASVSATLNQPINDQIMSLSHWTSQSINCFCPFLLETANHWTVSVSSALMQPINELLLSLPPWSSQSMNCVCLFRLDAANQWTVSVSSALNQPINELFLSPQPWTSQSMNSFRLLHLEPANQWTVSVSYAWSSQSMNCLCLFRPGFLLSRFSSLIAPKSMQGRHVGFPASIQNPWVHLFVSRVRKEEQWITFWMEIWEIYLFTFNAAVTSGSCFVTPVHVQESVVTEHILSLWPGFMDWSNDQFANNWHYVSSGLEEIHCSLSSRHSSWLVCTERLDCVRNPHGTMWGQEVNTCQEMWSISSKKALKSVFITFEILIRKESTQQPLQCDIWINHVSSKINEFGPVEFGQSSGGHSGGCASFICLHFMSAPNVLKPLLWEWVTNRHTRPTRPCSTV